MLPQLAKLGRTALNLLFPLWCLGCGREGVFICPSCRSQLPRITPPICPRCGLPKPEGAACPDCSGWQPAIGGIRAPFRFEGIVRRAIHELKYRNLRAAAEPLSELLGHYLEDNHIPAEVLAPVPLHQKRLRERGYNQSELLAMANAMGSVTLALRSVADIDADGRNRTGSDLSRERGNSIGITRYGVKSRAYGVN